MRRSQGKARLAFAGVATSAVTFLSVFPSPTISDEALAQSANMGITKFGNPFTVNATMEGSQSNPSVAIDRLGQSYIAFQSSNFLGMSEDGDGAGIFGRTFDWMRLPIGGQWQVNTYTTGDQTDPSVVIGDTVLVGGVSFSDFSGRDGDMNGVFYQKFVNGVLQFPGDFQVNLTTIGDQFDSFAFVKRGSLGTAFNILIGYEWFRPGLGSDLLMSGGFYKAPQATRRSGSTTRAIPGSEFQVNTHTPGYQGRGDGCAFTDDSFVVTWFSSAQDGDYGGIFAQRFDSANSPVGTEFQVNSYTTGNQDRPKVACDDSGFVVAWTSVNYFGPSQDGAGSGVIARRFDRSANPMGTEFIVNKITTGSQRTGDIAGDGKGNFVVLWRDYDFGGDLSLRGFASDLTPLTDDVVVASGAASNPVGTASMDMNTSGEFIVTWGDSGGGATGTDVMAQLFTLDTGATTTTTSAPTTTTSVTTTTTLPLPVCGDPSVNSAAPLSAGLQGPGVSTQVTITATDALLVLQAAVGSFACNVCVCDVNRGGITATDALIVLQFGVGQNVTLDCPPCT